MNRRNLVLLNVAVNWGSTGKIAEGIGELAISNGWNVYIAHGARYKNPTILTSIQVSNCVEEALHYFDSALFDAQGLGSKYATKKFIKKLDAIHPDLVHIHNIHGCFINYPLLFQYLKENDIPVVWTLHDCWAMTGHCVHFERTHCERWKTQCGHCPQIHDFPASYLFDRSGRNHALKKELFTALNRMRITTVSTWLENVASQSYLKKFPIDTVPNGIDTSLFVKTEGHIRDKFQIGDKKLLIAVAYGFEGRKGINDYVALSKVLPSDYQLLLVGANDKDRRMLPDNVIAIGRTRGIAELAAYYSTADVLLSLSYEETFGLTIIEAMACGTPAIVYDNTAQPELITPETGRVVPTGNISLLKDTIIAMCSIRKSEFSSACRKRAEQFDERMTYKKYLDIYAEMLSE